MTMGFTACDEEREFIVIDGNLPIKTSALYMVGDATPAGWNIDDPEPMTVDPNDSGIFTWEGELNTGEMKMPLATGSWSVGFIRPSTGNEEINGEEQVDVPFIMHSGDPDIKWNITEAGKYFLKINLHDWTFSCRKTGEATPIEVEPIEAEAVYMVGDAVACGWDIANALELEKVSKYIFNFHGELNPGEFKACTERDESWSCPFIRPEANGTLINADGCANDNFVYTMSPDNKWVVKTAGIYDITFDLENWKVDVQFIEGVDYDPEAIYARNVYIVGDATPNGWDIGNPTELTKSETDKYVYTYEGHLAVGDMKACTAKGTFEQAFIRPAANVEINAAGVADNTIIYTLEGPNDPDYKWKVTAAGEYRIVFNLQKYTIDVTCIKADGNEDHEPEPTPAGEPIVTDVLYIIGDATEGGWSLDAAQECTAESKYIFTWTGTLTMGGAFKVCTIKDFGANFIRPASGDVSVNINGVTDNKFVYTTDPDDKWIVGATGIYTLTFDLEHYTIDAVYVGQAKETTHLYIVGDATPNGWDIAKAFELTQDANDENVFTYTGKLTTGEMKACQVRDTSWGCPFLRPTGNGVTISETGVSNPNCQFTAGNPDYKWNVTKEGNYTVTFNIKSLTINVKYLD